MSGSSEQRDLSDGSSAKRRRAAAQHVREARDRLTSTTGTRPFFDAELLRVFAHNRLSASLVILLLVGVVGFLSSLWVGAVTAGTWTSAVLVIHAIIITKCREFLAQSHSIGDSRAWRMRFILLDLFWGLAWMFILIHPVGVEENSGTFMMFIMLLVVALSSTLSASVPMAMIAATAPVTAAVALNFALRGSLQDYILAILAVTAQCYFTLLTHRL
jgi:two-component system, cell cycle sensor histidine kinase PleC